jgi:molybdate transport system substrate-binding protein
MIHRNLLFVAACWGASSSVQAEDLNIAVAANFVSTFTELRASFEQSSGHRLRVSAGSSGRFYAQIKNGAPFDLFFSADQTKPQRLEAEGLVVPGSRMTYAIGALALWSANPELVTDGAEVLRRGEFNKLALANPRLAPYGVAAVEVLTQLGLREATQGKWVQGENIAQTYQFVSTGNAELGFVALSQITTAGQPMPGSAWLIPAQLYQPIKQDVVLLRRGQASVAAQALLAYVQSAAAQEIIEAHGYIWPANTSSR